jgi:hypothetical protein
LIRYCYGRRLAVGDRGAQQVVINMPGLTHQSRTVWIMTAIAVAAVIVIVLLIAYSGSGTVDPRGPGDGGLIY